MSDKPALTLAEAADRLGVCTVTARRLIDTGALQAVRIGRQWRIRPEAIERALTPPEAA